MTANLEDVMMHGKELNEFFPLFLSFYW